MIDKNKMTDEELEYYILAINANFNSHLEKGTIEMNIQYYNLLEEKMTRLINKNQNYEEEKQQIIKFLKHLIGETECAYAYKENQYRNSGKWNLLNEILDFVNKGSKYE